tara:strand:- start:6359 stop:7627 length:1269 start_codon:yes stop_codon:yes gene_type:complete
MADKAYMQPTLFRAATVRGLDQAPEIDRKGGKYGAGYIKNFAVITKGEALGHDSWVDDTFIAQVSSELKYAKKGIKSRYTHPNQCGDSLSKGLGRVFYREDGDGKVRGDLHFWKAAHNTPDGNLAGFLIDLAQDDPEAFGASISFMKDLEAMEEFAVDNPISPDPANVNNYPHIRLGQLRFVDIVDEPAANPDGLFHRDDTAAQAAKLLEYGLGLSDEKPEHQLFGVDADRLLGFVSNFLHLKGLQVMPIENEEIIENDHIEESLSEEAPSEVEAAELEAAEVEAPELEESLDAEEAPEPEAEPEAEAEAEAEAKAEADPVEDIVDGGSKPAKSPVDKGHFSKDDLSKYIDNFGKDMGVEFFMNDINFADAQSQYIIAQKEKIQELKAHIELGEQTEDKPLSGNNGEEVKPDKGQGFKVVIK